LVPAEFVIDRRFSAERDAIATLEADLAVIEQQLEDERDEQGGDDGLLAEVVENEGDRQKIAAKTVKARLKEIGKDHDYAEERAALAEYGKLLDQQADTKAKIKAAQEVLEEKLDARYAALTEDDVKTLTVEDKWLATLLAAVEGELDRVSQTLTGRIRQLAERYTTPLPQLNDEVEILAARVDGHLKKMGAAWN
jgi:type I restriction enzyme M protein